MTAFYANKPLYLSSDWHLGHDNVINYSNRPFAHIEEMHEALIRNWNAVVKPDDEAFYLGDFVWKNRYLDVLKQLNGNIHLIAGNHDNSTVRKHVGWASVDYYARIMVGDQKIILSHYPIECWDGMEKGSLHFHGHTHANISHAVIDLLGRFDVGVDSHAMRPISAQDLILRAQNSKLKLKYLGE